MKPQFVSKRRIFLAMDGFVVIMLLICAVCSLLGFSYHMIDLYYPISICSGAAIIYISFELGKVITRMKE